MKEFETIYLENIPCLVQIGLDKGDGFIFLEEDFRKSMNKDIERGIFIHYAQSSQEDLILETAIAKVVGFSINNSYLTLNVEFLNVSHSKATMQRLVNGWTSTSMKLLGEHKKDKSVKNMKILGFVESLKA